MLWQRIREATLLRLLTAAHGTHATCHDEALRSACRGNPDIDQTSPNDRVVNHSGHRQDRNAAAQRSAAVPYGVLIFGRTEAVPKPDSDPLHHYTKALFMRVSTA